ncbi:MAG: creatininase family protein, partial [Thermoprotei archaeon]
MKWEELTSTDLENINKETTVVILPVGSIEVHGPHLPLGTDTFIIYYVALKAAEEENAIVLPPLFYS